MKRPSHIFEILGKISDGTFLNTKEYTELENYIDDLEESQKECRLCKHPIIEHVIVQQDKLPGTYECCIKGCKCVVEYYEELEKRK